MAHEYEEFIDAMRFGLTMSDRDSTDDIWKMVDEVVNKAKAFEEIVIETTGAIMNCPPGAVETEAGRLTLDIIEKYDLEDK